MRFLQPHQQTAGQAAPSLRHYLADLRHSVRANIEGGPRAHPRYTCHFTAPQRARGAQHRSWAWAEQAAEDATGPLTYPTVSWWWSTDLTPGTAEKGTVR
ncbi:hypothetical protein ACH427_28025 [Streptomyces sp. NPDC020379]|uniref:hypothetical protein n=1 Tax=Streptomyces sp. NPDC020379 TaxID=3365071 RepID=UPI0037A608D9